MLEYVAINDNIIAYIYTSHTW